MSVQARRGGEAEVREVAVSADLSRDLAWLKDYLGYQISFDFIVREFRLGSRRAALVYFDTFVDQTVLTLIMETFLGAPDRATDAVSARELLSSRVPYIEVSPVSELSAVARQILAGPAALLVDGVAQAIVIDVRKYPDRSVQEPSLERVLRGPHDGFVETLAYNVVMVRRRLRDPNLRMELLQVGRRSQMDVVISYLDDVANKHFVQTVKDRLRNIGMDALPMSEKAVEEWLVRKPWWNPFPAVRFTERPDVAAEHLVEGHVLILVDTTPNALILPVTLFSFLQSVEEYHEGRVVGTYLKWVRFLGVGFSWLGPPLWYAMYASHAYPHALGPVFTLSATTIPVFWQLLGAELGVDILRLALTFSPDPLTQAMGFFGAILLGDIVVKAKILDAVVVVIEAVAAVGTFASPDLDFSLTTRMLRLFLVVLCGLGEAAGWVWAGFAVGTAVPLILALGTVTFGIGYLWPLLPFNAASLWSLLIRKQLTTRVYRPAMTLPRDETHQRPLRRRRR